MTQSNPRNISVSHRRRWRCSTSSSGPSGAVADAGGGTRTPTASRPPAPKPRAVYQFQPRPRDTGAISRTQGIVTAMADTVLVHPNRDKAGVEGHQGRRHPAAARQRAADPRGHARRLVAASGRADRVVRLRDPLHPHGVPRGPLEPRRAARWRPRSRSCSRSSRPSPARPGSSATRPASTIPPSSRRSSAC